MEQAYIISTVNAALNSYEKLVERGKIKSFFVYIQEEGILIKSDSSDAGKEITLLQELVSSLHTFFFGVTSIEYNSFDYATLKSFINASVCSNKLAS